MRVTLPRPLARAAALALAALACLAAPLAALEVQPPRLQRADGALWAEVRLSGLFSPRVEESLSRGMPARLLLHVELWRKRTAWFDRLESAFDGEMRVQYEAWGGVYRVSRRGAATLELGSLDSVRTVLTRPIAVRVAPTTRLQAGGRYYVVVTATLQPLSVEDVEQVEDWLSGEVDVKRERGFGAITELPRSVFDAVRNFAGFGDERDRAMSAEFVEAEP